MQKWRRGLLLLGIELDGVVAGVVGRGSESRRSVLHVGSDLHLERGSDGSLGRHD